MDNLINDWKISFSYLVEEKLAELIEKGDWDIHELDNQMDRLYQNVELTFNRFMARVANVPY